VVVAGGEILTEISRILIYQIWILGMSFCYLQVLIYNYCNQVLAAPDNGCSNTADANLDPLVLCDSGNIFYVPLENITN